jgi:hypothetical protein
MPPANCQPDRRLAREMAITPRTSKAVPEPLNIRCNTVSANATHLHQDY